MIETLFTGLATLAGSSGVGAIVGGVAALLRRREDRQARRDEMEHERAKWANDREAEQARLLAQERIAAAEAEGQLKVRLVEGEFDVAKADRAIIAQQLAGIARVQVAEASEPDDRISQLRRAIRPVATIWLLLLASGIVLVWLWLLSFGGEWGRLPEDVRRALMLSGLAWPMAQASGCLTYWFMTRPSGAEAPSLPTLSQAVKGSKA
jgi:hypothetical protein